MLKKACTTERLGCLQTEKERIVDIAFSSAESAVIVIAFDLSANQISLRPNGLSRGTSCDSARKIEDDAALRAFGISEAKLTRMA